MALSLSLAASFGFLINDFEDVPVDRVNRANRLENAGKNELRFIRQCSIGFLLAAFGSAALLGIKGSIAVGLISAGLTVYTFCVRQKLILATLLAAILSSTPLWVPNVVFGSLPSPLQMGVVVLSLILLVGREVIFDAEDIQGDSYGQRRTLATTFSRSFAVSLSLALNGTGAALLVMLLYVSKRTAPAPIFVMNTAGVLLFLWLILPPLYKVKCSPESRQHYKSFTQRSRLAMLLLPAFLLCF